MHVLPVIATALSYAVVCWGGGSVSNRDSSRLDKQIRRASSVVGMQLDSLVTVVEKMTLKKLLDIVDNTSHPLHTVISNQRSLFSDTLLCPIAYKTVHTPQLGVHRVVVFLPLVEFRLCLCRLLLLCFYCI